MPAKGKTRATRHKAENHVHVSVGQGEEGTVPVIRISTDMDVELTEAILILQRHCQIVYLDKIDHMLRTKGRAYSVHIEAINGLADDKVDVPKVLLARGFVGNCD